MSTHIGFDLVAVEEIQRALLEHGEQYLRRVYTARELTESRRSPRRLAACFAAKEATMKAFGRADEDFDWCCIELARDTPDGAARIQLSGGAATVAKDKLVERIEITTTYRCDHAAAIVTIKGGR